MAIDIVDQYTIDFNRLVLRALELSISAIYKRLIKHRLTPKQAEIILKKYIDRTALIELCPAVYNIITEQYNQAKLDVGFNVKNNVTYDQFNWDIKDMETLNVLRKNNVFLTSKYYNRLESLEVAKRIELIFDKGQSAARIAKDLRLEFNGKDGIIKNLKSYNEMFVNTISHTARNFANINTFEEIGVKYSQITGFKDELLCGQCSKLIGRIESVKTISKAMNNYISVDFEKLGYDKAIEEIKKVNNWLTEKDLINKGVEKPNYSSDFENHADTKKLFASGIPIPAHGNCRCSRKAIFKLE